MHKTMTVETTMKTIKEHRPCRHGLTKLLKGLGKTEADGTIVTLEQILEINGLDDALWYLRCWPEYNRYWRLLAVKYAREVQHLMTDERSIAALDTAERYANGEATEEELVVAERSAKAAERGAIAAEWNPRNTLDGLAAERPTLAAQAAAWATDRLALSLAEQSAALVADLAERAAQDALTERMKQKALLIETIREIERTEKQVS